MIFYMQLQHMVPDYCTIYMNKINPLFSEISQLHKIYEKVAIHVITQIWHGAKCYFTSMSNAWHLKTVLNTNKITTFFSTISQQTLKIYEKIAIIGRAGNNCNGSKS